MLVGVCVGDNGCALGIEPRVAIGVIEVPVRVDQVFDWIATEAVGGFKDSGAGRSDPGIDEYCSVCTRQDTDVAARSLKDANVAAQLMNLNGGFGRAVANQIDDVARLRVGSRRA
jgi:hypothetical protein